MDMLGECVGMHSQTQHFLSSDNHISYLVTWKAALIRQLAVSTRHERERDVEREIICC